jgi:putative acetyltransferase
MSHIVLRRAEPTDLPALADLWDRSRAVCLPFLPILHSNEEDIAFLTGHARAGQLTLALSAGVLAGFMVLTPRWINQLYLDPGQRGRGIGRTLVNHAKTGHDQLSLWCFADNLAAQGFYLSHGFTEQRRTDGDNEAGLPDILYGWQRPV